MKRGIRERETGRLTQISGFPVRKPFRINVGLTYDAKHLKTNAWKNETRADVFYLSFLDKPLGNLRFCVNLLETGKVGTGKIPLKVKTSG
jgi:hypothetical protein